MFDAAIQIPDLLMMKTNLTANEDQLLPPELEAMSELGNTAYSFPMNTPAQAIVRLPLFSVERHQESQRESVQTKFPLAFDNAGNQIIISLPSRGMPEPPTGPAVRPIPTAAEGHNNNRDQFCDVDKTGFPTRTQLHEHIQQGPSMINKECRLNVDRPLPASSPYAFPDALNLRSKGYDIEYEPPKKKRRISKTEDNVWLWEEFGWKQKSSQSL